MTFFFVLYINLSMLCYKDIQHSHIQRITYFPLYVNIKTKTIMEQVQLDIFLPNLRIFEPYP